MCLLIDTVHHPVQYKDISNWGDSGKFYSPKIAGYDMLVWKALIKDDDYGHRRFLTIFRLVPIKFGELVTAVMKRENTFYQIGAGLHAFYKMPPKLPSSKVLIYPAIIPKGTRFFFGHHGEIAAEAMIVYKTLEDALQGRRLGDGNIIKHKTDWKRKDI